MAEDTKASSPLSPRTRKNRRRKGGPGEGDEGSGREKRGKIFSRRRWSASFNIPELHELHDRLRRRGSGSSSLRPEEKEEKAEKEEEEEKLPAARSQPNTRYGRDNGESAENLERIRRLQRIRAHSHESGALYTSQSMGSPSSSPRPSASGGETSVPTSTAEIRRKNIVVAAAQATALSARKQAASATDGRERSAGTSVQGIKEQSGKGTKEKREQKGSDAIHGEKTQSSVSFSGDGAKAGKARSTDEIESSSSNSTARLAKAEQTPRSRSRRKAKRYREKKEQSEWSSPRGRKKRQSKESRSVDKESSQKKHRSRDKPNAVAREEERTEASPAVQRRENVARTESSASTESACACTEMVNQCVDVMSAIGRKTSNPLDSAVVAAQASNSTDSSALTATTSDSSSLDLARDRRASESRPLKMILHRTPAARRRSLSRTHSRDSRSLDSGYDLGLLEPRLNSDGSSPSPDREFQARRRRGSSFFNWKSEGTASTASSSSNSVKMKVGYKDKIIGIHMLHTHTADDLFQRVAFKISRGNKARLVQLLSTATLVDEASGAIFSGSESIYSIKNQKIRFKFEETSNDSEPSDPVMSSELSSDHSLVYFDRDYDEMQKMIENLQYKLQQAQERLSETEQKRQKGGMDLRNAETIRPIAKGGSGSCISECSVEGFVCVVKELPLLMSTKADVSQIYSELAVLKRLPYNPHTVRFLGYVHSEESIRIFLSRYDSSLSDFLKTRRANASPQRSLEPSKSCSTESPPYLPLSELLPVLSRIAQAVSFLHGCNIMHRDLKCGNVLCRVNDKQQITECVLSDFDSALITGSNVSRKYVSAKSFDVIGTPGCCAPEVLAAGSSSTGYGFPADVYSFGMIMFETMFLQGPYLECSSLKEVSDKVCAGTKPVIPPDHPQEYDGLIRLMHLCLSMEPGDRPSARCVTKDLTELEYAHCNGAGTASTAPANGEPC